MDGDEKPDHVQRDAVVDFDIYHPASRDSFYDRWLALAHDHDRSLVWTARNGGHWIALRGPDIHEIYADHLHFSAEVQAVPRLQLEEGEPRGLPTTLDPPEHGRYRALINPEFGRSVIAAVEGDIRALTIQLIESVRAQGHCEFVNDFARRLPLQVFMRLVDLPEDDRQMLSRWTDGMTRPTEGPEAALACFASLMDYIKPVIHERWDHPGDDMISKVVNRLVDGRRLTENEALGLTFQLVVAGLDTVASLLGFVMLHLARNGDNRQQLARNRDLIPRAVDEFIRRFPIVTMTRLVRHDYVFRDAELKAGDLVMIPSMLNNLDENVHGDPLRVDFDRPSGSMTTFGNGVHRCPGANLARLELKVTLEEWLRRIPDFEPGVDQFLFSQGVVGALDALPLRWPVAPH